MLRTVLKPRWLGLFAALVVVLGVCVELGLWQLSVARNQAAADAVREAPTRAVVPLADLTGPHESFPDHGSGRRVTVTGTYDAGRQVLVGPRRLDGVTGWWVVTPMVESGSQAWLAVVRGFVADPAAAPAPPTGTVELTGSLAPAESTTTSPPAPSPLPPVAAPGGVLGSVDLAQLVNAWPGDLYNLFTFALDERADAAPVAAGLERVPPPSPDTGLNWRNTAYALQWWVFGLFAAWMWWRMVRDDHAVDREAAAAVEQDQQQHDTDERQEALT